jgi:hypothetical protein
MAVRSNVQKPYDASLASFTMAKKFVTAKRLGNAAIQPLKYGCLLSTAERRKHQPVHGQ